MTSREISDSGNDRGLAEVGALLLSSPLALLTEMETYPDKIQTATPTWILSRTR
jgi:hypothetical protein